MDQRTSHLEARLSKIEREVRFCRIAMAATVLLLFVMGATSPSDEIVAKRITVINDKGQPLVTLGSWGQGSGGLILVNSMAGTESPVESIKRNSGGVAKLVEK